MSKNLAVIGGGEMSPTEMVKSLAHQDKATIMSLCMPKGATDADLALYLYRCKEMGFDPLSGELVLQKRKMKEGSTRLNFITTRDALLRKAAEHLEYQGINSGVVREGDTYLVDTEKGVVKHTFGSKRGKLIAGWAVVYHKKRIPVVASVDFQEYFQANNNSPVWRSMPSAMIQKVAEVAALRRQFPVGVQGIYTAEEMELAEESPAPTMQVIEGDKVEEPLKLERKEEPQKVNETSIATDKSAKETNAPAKSYQLVAFSTGKSGTGTPFAKILAEEDGQQVLFLAKGEDGLAEAAKLKEGCSFTATVTEESGFNFISNINVV